MDTVMVVLKRSVAGRGFAAYRGVGAAVGDWIFEEGKPVRVAREFAEALVSNNNQEWQTVEHDFFEIVPEEPVMPEYIVHTPRKSKGGEG